MFCRRSCDKLNTSGSSGSISRKHLSVPNSRPRPTYSEIFTAGTLSQVNIRPFKARAPAFSRQFRMASYIGCVAHHPRSCRRQLSNALGSSVRTKSSAVSTSDSRQPQSHPQGLRLEYDSIDSRLLLTGLSIFLRVLAISAVCLSGGNAIGRVLLLSHFPSDWAAVS